MTSWRTHIGRYHLQGAQPGERPIPYILGVTSLVLEAGGDDDEAIAALCHDVPEDHGDEERLVEIREHFGSHVENIVRGLFDRLGPEYEEKGPIVNDRELTHPDPAVRDALQAG